MAGDCCSDASFEGQYFFSFDLAVGLPTKPHHSLYLFHPFLVFYIAFIGSSCAGGVHGQEEVQCRFPANVPASQAVLVHRICRNSGHPLHSS